MPIVPGFCHRAICFLLAVSVHSFLSDLQAIDPNSHSVQILELQRLLLYEEAHISVAFRIEMIRPSEL